MNVLQEIEAKMIRRNYSPSTVTTYIGILKKYVSFCKEHNLNPKEDVYPFLHHIIKSGYSVSYQNQVILIFGTNTHSVELNTNSVELNTNYLWLIYGVSMKYLWSIYGVNTLF